VSLRRADLDRLDAARGEGTPGEVNRSKWVRLLVLAGLDAIEMPDAPAPALVRAAERLHEIEQERPGAAALRERALASDVEPVADPAELALLSVESHAAQIAEEAGYEALAPEHAAEDPGRRQAARAARRPRNRTARPRSAPTATELANERRRDAREAERPVEPPGTAQDDCPHTFPDVKNVAGVRICKKCKP